MAFESMSKEHGQTSAVIEVDVSQHHGIDPAPIDLGQCQISLLVFPGPTNHAAIHDNSAASCFNQRA